MKAYHVQLLKTQAIICCFYSNHCLKPTKSLSNNTDAVLFATGSVNQECNEIIDNKVVKEFGEGDLPLSDVKNDDLIPRKDKKEIKELADHGDRYSRSRFFHPRTKNRFVKDVCYALDETNYYLQQILKRQKQNQKKEKT